MTSNFSEDKKQKRHWLIGIAIGFGALISLGVLVLFVLWLPIWDIEPVDDADMYTEWHPIPEHENAIKLLEEDWPEWKSVSEEVLKRWRDEPDVYTDEIAAFFEETEPLVERLDAILEVGAVQFDRLERYEDVLPGVSAILSLGNLQLQRIQLLRDRALRFEALKDFHTYTRMMSVHVDSFLHFNIVLATENKLMEAFWDHLQDEQLPAAHLEELRSMVDSLKDLRPLLVKGYQSEYRVFSNLSDLNFPSFHKGPGVDWISTLAKFGVLFQPNRTDENFLQILRSAIDDLNRYAPWDETEPLPWNNLSTRFNRSLSPNMLGDLLVEFFNPVTDGTYLHVLNAEMQRVAFVSGVALHQYRHEAGDWPEDLADLVPGFLETVPVDPFDGEPMRYRKEERMIYSVGPDRVDQGGSRRSLTGKSEAKTHRDMEDLVFVF